MNLLNPHGVLFTCSCSGRVSREAFIQTLNAAAVKAGKALQIINILGADADHPVSVGCPETQYLKCVVAYA
jgi:23S rRNA (cytosine1962-C5)-methyltransferase